jgi:hypothetical protein
MVKTVMVLTLAGALCATSAAAQQQSSNKPDDKAAAAAKTEPRAPVVEPLPVNIRIEVVITDQAGPGETSKKTVSMIVGDRQQNSIRTSAQVRERNSGGLRPVGINVDARPIINAKEPNKVQLMFGLEYSPKTGSGGNASDAPEPSSSSLSQRITLNLESGKPLLVSQAADPASDRKITVEVTATILK